MESKGRERVSVVRGEGAKIPADIGGGIYLSLKDRNDIAPIQMVGYKFSGRSMLTSPCTLFCSIRRRHGPGSASKTD